MRELLWILAVVGAAAAPAYELHLEPERRSINSRLSLTSKIWEEPASSRRNEFRNIYDNAVVLAEPHRANPVTRLLQKHAGLLDTLDKAPAKVLLSAGEKHRLKVLKTELAQTLNANLKRTKITEDMDPLALAEYMINGKAVVPLATASQLDN